MLASAGVSDSGSGRFSRAICDRHTGVGADGVEIVDATRRRQADASIRLFNSDGSEAEISGNGTRCVAAYLLDRGLAEPAAHRDPGRSEIAAADRAPRERCFSSRWGWAGRPIRREEVGCRLDTALGRPRRSRFSTSAIRSAPCWWRISSSTGARLGREIESHPRFPQRTNVSFVRVVDPHRIEVRFWERGAGETMSSGTGSTGAVVAAILAGRAKSPVTVVTAGRGDELALGRRGDAAGPARLVARGAYLRG